MKSSAKLILMLLLLALVVSISVPVVAAPQEQTSHRAQKYDGGIASVVGAVRSPTRIVMKRRVKLLEAITVSGGVTEEAKGNVEIRHADATTSTYSLAEIESNKAEANPELKAGDIVTVK